MSRNEKPGGCIADDLSQWTREKRVKMADRGLFRIYRYMAGRNRKAQDSEASEKILILIGVKASDGQGSVW